MEWECFWVNLREDNKSSDSKMAVSESNMAEFKMAAIIKLSKNESVKFFCAKWLNPWWQNSRWLPSSSWVKMNEFESDWTSLSQSLFCKMDESKMAEFKMAAIIKLSENEWVWVRLNQFESESEWSESVFELIWEKITSHLIPRWQCLNPTWQNSRWLPSSSWVRMNQWSFFVQNGLIHDGRIQDGCHHQVESKWMSFSQIELVWVRVFLQNGWIQDGRIQDGCHHQVKWEWMSLSQIESVWVRVRNGVRVFLS